MYIIITIIVCMYKSAPLGVSNSARIQELGHKWAPSLVAIGKFNIG